MAAQNVGAVVPRLRRAIEGPVQVTGPNALTDDQLTAMAADAIADLILYTSGAWNHELQVAGRSGDPDTGPPDEWTIDPPLKPEEESMIAAQAALTYFFHAFKDRKVSERIKNEGQEWEYAFNGPMLRDWLRLLQTQRDEALAALKEEHPVLARYASFLEVRDQLAAVQLEPWTTGGLGGGQVILGGYTTLGFG
jgi:hypothetical protein